MQVAPNYFNRSTGRLSTTSGLVEDRPRQTYPEPCQPLSRKRKRLPSPELESRCVESPTPSKAPDERFSGLVIVRPLVEARRFAWLMHSPPAIPNVVHHVFWADCSIYLRCGAAAVVYQTGPSDTEWVERSYPLPFSTSNPNLVEILAIARALEIAIALVKEDQESTSEEDSESGQHTKPETQHLVLVFSDSINALDRIRRDSFLFHDVRYWEQVHEVFMNTTQLQQLGASVELHLVPGHKGIAGNVLADRLAKRTARELAASTIPSIPSPIRSAAVALSSISAPTSISLSALVPASANPNPGSNENVTSCKRPRAPGPKPLRLPRLEWLHLGDNESTEGGNASGFGPLSTPKRVSRRLRKMPPEMPSLPDPLWLRRLSTLRSQQPEIIESVEAPDFATLSPRALPFRFHNVPTKRDESHEANSREARFLTDKTTAENSELIPFSPSGPFWHAINMPLRTVAQEGTKAETPLPTASESTEAEPDCFIVRELIVIHPRSCAPTNARE